MKDLFWPFLGRYVNVLPRPFGHTTWYSTGGGPHGAMGHCERPYLERWSVTTTPAAASSHAQSTILPSAGMNLLPTRSTHEKTCEIPGCDTTEIQTRLFDDTNITCMQCGHFICSVCTDRIWKGEWSDETFPKPKYFLPGAVHQVWTCPFCRASFDRSARVPSTDA